MSASGFVHVEGKILRATYKAILVRLEESEEEHWLPRSQVANGGDYEEGDSGTISISEWLAKKIGLDA